VVIGVEQEDAVRALLVATPDVDTRSGRANHHGDPVQLALVAGSLEWLRTLLVIAVQRQHAGLPWLRMAMIIGTVAALALLAAWLFQTARLGRIYGLRARDDALSARTRARRDT
jgi:hypothetical protein